MFEFRIVEVKISKIGITFKFNERYTQVWHYVPGALQVPNKRRFRTLVLPGVFNLERTISLLENLPVIDKRKVDVNLRTTYPVIKTPTYKKKGYTPFSDKVRPHPTRVPTTQRIVESVEFIPATR